MFASLISYPHFDTPWGLEATHIQKCHLCFRLGLHHLTRRWLTLIVTLLGRMETGLVLSSDHHP